MQKFVMLVGLTLGFCAVSVPPANAAATRNYDCTKAGNAHKAVCKKTTASAAKAVAKSSPKKAAPKPAATKVSSTTVTKTTTERTYDCSKAGNKNKAVCKVAKAAAAPAAKQTTTATATRHYDCTKAGNANKAACKTSVTMKQATVVRPSPARPAALPRVAHSAPAPAVIHAAGPSGATAMCNDRSYSHSKDHRGACSHHNGVAKWY